MATRRTISPRKSQPSSNEHGDETKADGAASTAKKHVEKAGKEKQRPTILDRQVHKPRDSLFSFSSGYNNYRGFLNLSIVLLILSNGRLVLENIIKYGILVDPLQWFTVVIRDPHRWPCLTLCLATNFFVLVALKMEQWLYKKAIPERIGVGIQIVNLSAVLLFPAVAVWFLRSYLLASFLTMITYSCVFLKLTSYVMVNRWYRLEAFGLIPSRQFEHPETKAHRDSRLVKEPTSEVDVVRYPDNLTVKNLYYFYFAPTLCYELNYPRNATIRKMYLAKRIGEILLLTQLELALAQQWLLPIMQNSVVPLRDSDWSKVLERLLKLALPNHCMWLIGFYLGFHSIMNAVAEVMRFADREFYRDWWNAETVQDFWRNWNMPVHRWAVRHVYTPIVDHGYKKWQAALVVFIISAFFHEYIVSIPLRIFRLWAFMGMLTQVPFAMFVSKFMKGRLGNIAVWLSLIVGQPLAIFMYFHDYYVLERGNTTSFI